VRADFVEAKFFGLMPWITIQRVTLPLAVFFHFHSAVVCIELFKEVFARKKTFDSTNQDFQCYDNIGGFSMSPMGGQDN
jgi:hypothetical protein